MNQMTSIKTYSELITLPTFEERYKYLRLGGRVGEETFGFDRYLNQWLYHNKEWTDNVRPYIIFRDSGPDFCSDLGILDREIVGRIFVHHMNPITKEDILYRPDYVLDPEFLICCSKRTHDAIHYGDDSILIPSFIERTPNDTCPWKRTKIRNF